jgi:hypothetical protein
MKYKDFEDYIINKHAEQYRGTDDLMPEDYEEWVDELDVRDVIKWANDWGKTL